MIELKLHELLAKKEITLYRFCKDTKISYQQGSYLVKNKTNRIDFNTIEKICNYFDCKPSDFLNLKNQERIPFLEKIISDLPQTNLATRTPIENDSVRPFLQWAGGKRSLIKQYESYFPATFKRYLEPFLGGGALFFHLKPKKSILNDLNKEIIQTYEAVRDNPEVVIKLLGKLKKIHSKESYKLIRDLDRDVTIFKKLTAPEKAARMIYLNQTCFNGIYRVNRSGHFNVPIGSSLNKTISDPSAILNASKLLKKTELYSLDFSEIAKMATRGDFVYLDPPYDPISKYSDFTRYTKEQFSKVDQMRLAETFISLHKKGCKVMLSNSNTPFVKNLYKGFTIREVFAPRNLNSKAEGRGKISELIITNYK